MICVPLLIKSVVIKTSNYLSSTKMALPKKYSNTSVTFMFIMAAVLFAGLAGLFILTGKTSKKDTFFIFMFIVLAIFFAGLSCWVGVCVLYRKCRAKKLHPQTNSSSVREEDSQ